MSLAHRSQFGPTPLLRMQRAGAVLVLSGECDVTSAPELTDELRKMETHRTVFGVDLSRVTFADTHGLEPLAESVRRCRRRPAHELRVDAASPFVHRVFALLGVALDPFDLHAWDEPSSPALCRFVAATDSSVSAPSERASRRGRALTWPAT